MIISYTENVTKITNCLFSLLDRQAGCHACLVIVNSTNVLFVS